MGNELYASKGSATSFIQRNLSFKRKKIESTDQYIIEYTKQRNSIKVKAQPNLKKPDNEHINKRVVFVSLLGTYQTWEQAPPHVLYSAIVILPFKQDWLNQPSQHENDIKAHFASQVSAFQADMEKFKRFMRFIRWKDSQNLVIWTLDDYYNKDGSDMIDMSDSEKSQQRQDIEGKNENILIAPFWRYFSIKLTKLYYPITRKNYKPLIFNEKWWTKKWNKQSDIKYKYIEKTSSILAELYLLTMKYKCMKEIIFQSNPSSLYPVTFYNEPVDNFVSISFLSDQEPLSSNNMDPIDNMEPRQDCLCIDSIQLIKDDQIEELGETKEEPQEPEDTFTYDEDEDEWFISSDYDPYDIDPNMDFFNGVDVENEEKAVSSDDEDRVA